MTPQKPAGRVTMKDIAEKTGYTVNTVSRALKNRYDIADETRARIQATARQMGYIENALAGALRTGSTHTVAIVLGDIANPHFAILTKEIERNARAAGFSSVIFNTGEDEAQETEAVRLALARQVSGVILCPAQQGTGALALLRRSGVPFVLMGRCFEDEATDYVVCDDAGGAALAVGHLLDGGSRRVLFLNGPPYISSASQRLAGYRAAHQSRGLAVDEGLIHTVQAVSGNCYATAKTLLAAGLAFDAVFAFSDMLAWEAVLALNEAGRAVPGDVPVVGFDNIQSQFYFPFPLTTVGTQKRQMAKTAFEVLHRRMAGEGPDAPVQIVIETTLVRRGSA